MDFNPLQAASDVVDWQCRLDNFYYPFL